MRLIPFILLALLTSSARSEGVSDTPSDPVFVDLAGRQVHASDHLGEVVLLHFWATWCGACRPEMPLFVRLHDEFGPKGLRLIAPSANARDEADLVRRYMADASMRFDTWLWVSAKDMKYYGVGPGLPATVLLDRTGRVRGRFQGRADEAQLRALVTEVLAEAPPKTP